MMSESERARRYDAWFSTPLGRAMDAAEERAVMELADPHPGERALDAGCGTGIYTRRLLERGAAVTGIDLDLEMMGAARLKAPAATFVEADVTALPFPDSTFDLSLAVTLLCFVDDAERAVAELARVTRPGGRVVLAELNRWSLWAAWRRIKGWRGSETWRHVRFFSPGDLAILLRQGGARNIRTAAAAYLPPAAPEWLRARAPALERRAKRLGSVGAAFSLARGEVAASSAPQALASAMRGGALGTAAPPQRGPSHVGAGRSQGSPRR
jgi:SAM-dependent methyltransferase